MKNMDAYIMISIVSLILVVATAFLMTAADAPIREAGMYLPLICGAIGTWAASEAGLLEMHYEERPAHCNAHNAA